MPDAEPLDAVDPDAGPPCATRRAVLAGVCGVGLTAALGGCSVYGSNQSAGQPTAQASAGGEVAKVADVPVGGGKVIKGKGVVLTQPEEGTIKAYSSECTHQGCEVTSVSDGTINCDCHGSKFKVEDGSVAGGPAKRALGEVKVSVNGDSVVLA